MSKAVAQRNRRKVSTDTGKLEVEIVSSEGDPKANAYVWIGMGDAYVDSIDVRTLVAALRKAKVL